MRDDNNSPSGTRPPHPADIHFLLSEGVPPFFLWGFCFSGSAVPKRRTKLELPFLRFRFCFGKQSSWSSRPTDTRGPSFQEHPIKGASGCSGAAVERRTQHETAEPFIITLHADLHQQSRTHSSHDPAVSTLHTRPTAVGVKSVVKNAPPHRAASDSPKGPSYHRPSPVDQS